MTSYVVHPVKRRRRRRDPRAPLKLPAGITAESLRALADQAPNIQIRKRLLSAAWLAEGLSCLSAAARVRLSEYAVQRVRALLEAGNMGLLLGSRGGARCRLTPAQVNELAAFVRGHKATAAELCAWVKRRFDVDYTPRGITRLVGATVKMQIIGGRIVAYT